MLSLSLTSFKRVCAFKPIFQTSCNLVKHRHSDEKHSHVLATYKNGIFQSLWHFSKSVRVAGIS